MNIKKSAKFLMPLIPQVFSFLLLIAGTKLLVSGAMPSVPENMEWLSDVFPLPVIEISHLLGSLIGVLLLFLARGVHLRIDAAWYGSILLLTLGIISSLLTGLNWEDAFILAFMLILMLPAKRYFRRRSPLLTIEFTPQWFLLIITMLIGVAWIGFFSFRHVEYSNDLWWQFSYKADAPRFLRALVTVSTVVTFYILWRLTSIVRPRKARMPGKEEIDMAQALAIKGTDPQAFLSLLGDKQFFWSETKRSFIMYAVRSKYWIAMGNPVGDEEEFEALLWKFLEAADKVGAKPVFYQVSKEHLTLYMDIGLVLLKMGEEARISLDDFSLKGKKRSDLRGGRNRLTKLQYTFAVLEGDEISEQLQRLGEISDLWLSKKGAHEKGFSLGFFDPEYIVRTRVAVVQDVSGKIMAFANIWELDNKQELCVDLMRYDPGSPSGIMDYLFAELMLWGQKNGFHWFNLGLAPLAGLHRHRLAPLWHKIGTLVYDTGEELYNFEGVYKYKAKFEPEDWNPRYLAVAPGLKIPAVLLITSALISGGWKEMFVK